MARPATASFNIAQLERILQDRRSEVNRLERQRSELQRKLDGVERQITRLNGSLRGLRGMRGRRGVWGFCPARHSPLNPLNAD